MPQRFAPKPSGAVQVSESAELRRATHEVLPDVQGQFQDILPRFAGSNTLKGVASSLTVWRKLLRLCSVKNCQDLRFQGVLGCRYRGEQAETTDNSSKPLFDLQRRHRTVILPNQHGVESVVGALELVRFRK